MDYLLHTLLLLHKLFVYVIGDDTEYRTAKTERLFESICQDLCRAATGGTSQAYCLRDDIKTYVA